MRIIYNIQWYVNLKTYMEISLDDDTPTKKWKFYRLSVGHLRFNLRPRFSGMRGTEQEDSYVEG